MSSLGDLSALVGQLTERNQESQKVLNCVEGKLAAMDLDLRRPDLSVSSLERMSPSQTVS